MENQKGMNSEVRCSVGCEADTFRKLSYPEFYIRVVHTQVYVLKSLLPVLLN